MKYFLSIQEELLELAYYSELRCLFEYAEYLLECAITGSLIFYELQISKAPAWMTRIVYKIAVQFQLVEVTLEEWLDIFVNWV